MQLVVTRRLTTLAEGEQTTPRGNRCCRLRSIA